MDFKDLNKKVFIKVTEEKGGWQRTDTKSKRAGTGPSQTNLIHIFEGFFLLNDIMDHADVARLLKNIEQEIEVPLRLKTK